MKKMEDREDMHGDGADAGRERADAGRERESRCREMKEAQGNGEGAEKWRRRRKMQRD